MNISWKSLLCSTTFKRENGNQSLPRKTSCRWRYGGGGKGNRNIFSLEVSPQDLNLLTYIYHFPQKRLPFVHPRYENGTPFTYLERINCMSFLNFPVEQKCSVGLFAIFLIPTLQFSMAFCALQLMKFPPEKGSTSGRSLPVQPL